MEVIRMNKEIKTLDIKLTVFERYLVEYFVDTDILLAETCKLFNNFKVDNDSRVKILDSVSGYFDDKVTLSAVDNNFDKDYEEVKKWLESNDLDEEEKCRLSEEFCRLYQYFDSSKFDKYFSDL